MGRLTMLRHTKVVRKSSVLFYRGSGSLGPRPQDLTNRVRLTPPVVRIYVKQGEQIVEEKDLILGKHIPEFMN